MLNLISKSKETKKNNAISFIKSLSTNLQTRNTQKLSMCTDYSNKSNMKMRTNLIRADLK